VADFDTRIAHVLEHSNELIEGAPKWKDLDEYIFSFNIQNEGQGHLNGNVAPVPGWWCDRAERMRDIMGNSGVLISTGECSLAVTLAMSTTAADCDEPKQAAATNSLTPTSRRIGLAKLSMSSTYTRTAASRSSGRKVPSHCSIC
jgi:hypothetical protein